MNQNLINELNDLIKRGEDLAPRGGNILEGYNGREQPDYVSWRLQAITAIDELGKLARPLLQDLESDNHGSYFYSSSAQRVLGVLKAALTIAEKQTKKQTQDINQLLKGNKQEKSNQVFVVHGHDEALLHQVARFTERLDIKPIILFEKAGKGKTIIEKLESHSSVPFAIVLFTPDDMGKGAKEEGELHPRARQNVVLELGYFLGKLGRSNVAVLYDESIELPSDYRGVEYIKIDAEGAWKLKLARELKEAGLNVDMNKAI